MTLVELLLIAFGLSMDAFAVAICTGLAMEKATLKKSLKVGAYFGVFQAGMPIIGYCLAMLFADKITAYDHWIAFALLCFLGVKMIVDSFRKDKCTIGEPSLKPATMLTLAVATSIDAMAVGASFAFLKVDIVKAIVLIGVSTLVISMLGVKIGNVFGTKLKSKAEAAGGIILLLIGANILLSHIGVY